MRQFFESSEDDEDSTAVLQQEDVQELLRGAIERAASPPRPDDVGRLKRRLRELEIATSSSC